MNFKNSLAMLLFSFLFLRPVYAAEFYCEVVDVSGTASISNDSSSRKSIKEGDLLIAGDTLVVERDSYVDLAYDRDRLNVTRIESDSTVKIRSIVPGSILMTRGGLYAKLKSLPKDSTFVVETPDAIASVRGTEYRTFTSSEGTQVFNLSKSDVFIFGKSASGEIMAGEGQAQILKMYEKAEPFHAGQLPPRPRRMSGEEMKKHANLQNNLEHKIRERSARGKSGKMQDVKQMSRYVEAGSEHAQAANRQSLVSTEGVINTQKGESDNYLLKSDGLSQRMDEAAENYEAVSQKEAKSQELDKAGRQEKRIRAGERQGAGLQSPNGPQDPQRQSGSANASGLEQPDPSKKPVIDGQSEKEKRLQATDRSGDQGVAQGPDKPERPNSSNGPNGPNAFNGPNGPGDPNKPESIDGNGKKGKGDGRGQPPFGGGPKR